MALLFLVCINNVINDVGALIFTTTFDYTKTSTTPEVVVITRKILHFVGLEKLFLVCMY